MWTCVDAALGLSAYGRTSASSSTTCWSARARFTSG